MQNHDPRLAPRPPGPPRPGQPQQQHPPMPGQKPVQPQRYPMNPAQRPGPPMPGRQPPGAMPPAQYQQPQQQRPMPGQAPRPMPPQAQPPMRPNEMQSPSNPQVYRQQQPMQPQTRPPAPHMNGIPNGQPRPAGPMQPSNQRPAQRPAYHTPGAQQMPRPPYPMQPGQPQTQPQPAPPQQKQMGRPYPPQPGGFAPRPMPPQGPVPPGASPPAQQAAMPNVAQNVGPGVPPRPISMRPNAAANPARPMPPGYAPPQQGGLPPQRPGMAPAHPYPPQAPQQAPDGQARLSSSMMPRPCAVEKTAGTPREFYHRGKALAEVDGSAPTVPNSSTDVIYVDNGSARMRFMRLTTNSIGAEPSIMNKSGVPLAVVMTPFANTAPGEDPIPVVDFSNPQVGGPLRCERCNGYANPGFKFLSGGSQFQCNLCSHINKTPAEHFSSIAPATGQRMDADTRHELCYGSVDYVVGSPDYCIRPPRPACYLFAVDVSTGAISSGLSYAAMMSIKSAISAGLLPGSREGARVGIMTFDRALHFFDARGAEEGKAVTMQYVPDVMDPFVPLGGDALFLTSGQAVMAIDSAIETHGLGPNQQRGGSDQNAAAQHGSPECALGSALEALKTAFADCGGKAFVVAGSLPSIGVSKLERRGGGAIGGGEDRELALLREASPNYEILGCELAEMQASVDLFLAPSSVYIDAATLSRVPRACGGRLHLFTGFDPVRDGASLHRSLCAAASGPRAFEALLRVRTSPGLEARGEYVGHFGRPQRGDDVGGPVFDSSSTLALEISVSSKLSDDDRNSAQGRPYGGSASLYDDACIQCAILFTDSAGRRRIRVHTLFASKTTVLQDIFRHADVDALAAFLSKKAASAVHVGGTSFSKACEALTERTAQCLYVYRKHCSNSSMSGQLILPEAVKTLPVMMLGLTKSAAFRKSAVSMQSGDAVTVDERAAALSFLTSATPTEIAAFCYPRMWEVQEIGDAIGKPLPPPADRIVSYANGDTGKQKKPNEPIALPNTLPLSAESLTDERILLIENGMQMVVWLGSRVPKTAAEDVVAPIAGGRLCIRGETAGSAALTKDISERGQRVAKMIGRIIAERHCLSRPQVVVRNAPGAGGEAKFVMPLLVEDRGGGTFSYVEYLRHVHKRVMDKMANDSAQSDMQTWEMLNHGY